MLEVGQYLEIRSKRFSSLSSNLDKIYARVDAFIEIESKTMMRFTPFGKRLITCLSVSDDRTIIEQCEYTVLDIADDMHMKLLLL
jgi:hypothetical protein